MILMKSLEAKKRVDEREKKREDMRVKGERERERRLEQKRLELEVISEMRKPIEDMSLDDHKDLPELKRLKGGSQMIIQKTGITDFLTHSITTVNVQSVQIC